MKLTICSHNPAWGGEYEAYTEKQELFRVKISRVGNFHHIRVFDTEGNEMGHVYQDRYGIAGECCGKVLLTVERQMGPQYQMVPVVKSDVFRWFELELGDIRERDYHFYANRRPIRVCPSACGVVVECEDFPAQPIEVLVLILAVEAIAQYT